MKASNYLQNHKQYTEADYAYLSNKGYTNKEILTFWDREEKEQKDPCTHSIDFETAYNVAALKAGF